MSGDDDTGESWEPIPSLSSLSPFSSPALSFLILSATQEHESYSQNEQGHDGDVNSDEVPSPPKTPSPRPRTPQNQTNPSPQTARASTGRTHSQQQHHQPPHFASPTSLSSLGLGLHQMALGSTNLSRPPLSPLHGRTAYWVSHARHGIDIRGNDETAMSFNDADDEDEGESGAENGNVNMDPQKHISTGNGDQYDEEDHDEEEDHEGDELGAENIEIYADSPEDIYADEDDDAEEDEQDEDQDDDEDEGGDRGDFKEFQERDGISINTISEEHNYDDNKENEPPDRPLSAPQDSRDVLVERISDLLSRLSSTVTTTSPSTEQELLSILHSKVDEMELVLEAGYIVPERSRNGATNNILEHRYFSSTHSTSRSRSRSRTPVQQSFESMPDTLSPTPAAIGEKYYQAMGLSLDLSSTTPPPHLPAWLSSPLKVSDVFPESPTAPELTAATNQALEAAKEAAQAQADLSERVAREAEELRTELTRVVRNLKIRREESDHLHALLVERAEAAAGRIMELEKEVSNLEEDLNSATSDIRHLRLEMRAIETLVNEFINPREADPDLFQAIQNWKSDWALVRERVITRQRSRLSSRDQHQHHQHQPHDHQRHQIHDDHDHIHVPTIQVIGASNPSSFSSRREMPLPPNSADQLLMGLSSPILSMNSTGGRRGSTSRSGSSINGSRTASVNGSGIGSGMGSGSNTLITSSRGGGGNGGGGGGPSSSSSAPSSVVSSSNGGSGRGAGRGRSILREEGKRENGLSVMAAKK
ncbi:hypothetical protein QBC43DRAFT_314047 [Cladorrhinum sp. PSN259]|nr:hypothetical protein QBC43DRAFT_314047 [Cladorrhinum sp. PSN259]